MQQFIELIEGYNDKRLWVNVHTGQIVEAEQYHNLTVYRSPEIFGLDAANPILRKYDGVEETQSWTNGLINDEEIKFLAFLNGWVRAIYSQRNRLEVEAADDQAARVALDWVLGHRYSANLITLDIGTLDPKCFRLNGLDEIEAYINKGRKPRNSLPEEFWDASALFHYLREGEFEPHLCWPLVSEWASSNGLLDTISEVLDDNIDTADMLSECDPGIFYALSENDQTACANWCLDFLIQHNPQAPRAVMNEEEAERSRQPLCESASPITEQAEVLIERGTRATSGRGEEFMIMESPSSAILDQGDLKGLLSRDGERLLVWPAEHATHHVAYGFHTGLDWDRMLSDYLNEDRDIEADMLVEWTPVWIDQNGVKADRDVSSAPAIRRLVGRAVLTEGR